jgi:hypothetical protein
MCFFYFFASSDREAAEPVMDARSAMLAQIAKKPQLKSVATKAADAPKPAAASNANASIMEILSRRTAIAAESSSSDDDEWND